MCTGPSSLREAILSTLHYFDLLDFPLTLQELHAYLYGWQASQEEIQNALEHIPEVIHSGSWYALRGREALFEKRLKRDDQAKRLWKRVERWRFLFEIVPFVRMVAVCNTLAYGNVKPTSDIDLFVVVKDGHLATGSFFLKILTHMFRLRRHGKKIAGRFCLSFFVTESALNLKPLAHVYDPCLAYFTTTMTPLFGEGTYRHFLKSNEEWVFPYFKRPLIPLTQYMKSHVSMRASPSITRRAGRPLSGATLRLSEALAAAVRWIFERVLELLGQKFENFLFARQMKREEARSKDGRSPLGVIVNRSVFKFHESDPRRQIADHFESRLNSILMGVP